MPLRTSSRHPKPPTRGISYLSLCLYGIIIGKDLLKIDCFCEFRPIKVFLNKSRLRWVWAPALFERITASLSTSTEKIKHYFAPLKTQSDKNNQITWSYTSQLTQHNYVKIGKKAAALRLLIYKSLSVYICVDEFGMIDETVCSNSKLSLNVLLWSLNINIITFLNISHISPLNQSST